MRPMFAIAPLALAFILLGPATNPEASAPDSPSLAAKVWHMLFDHDDVDTIGAAQNKPTASFTKASALSR